MNLLITIVAFLLALGILVVIHEYGHYLVARLCGVKILRFSVGFGKALWTTRRGRDQTEWVLAALPLGGYVKMLDEREGPVRPEELDRAFNRKNVWQRIAIVAAGPVANFLLAILIYWALFVHGVQEAKPVIAAPLAGSVAEQSGLKRGDTIQSINGERIASWQDARWRLLKSAVAKEELRLETLDFDGRINTRILDLSRLDMQGYDGDPMVRIGLGLYRPDVGPVIGKLVPRGVAEASGLKAGDRITAVDGVKVTTWDEVVAAVRAHPDSVLKFRVARETGELDIEVVPQATQQGAERIGRIGAGPYIDLQVMKNLLTEVRYGPFTAFTLALERTWDTSIFSLRMLGKMLIGEVSWKNLSGPVTIADYAGQSAQLGLIPYISFLALISISLGVLNLLPIPLLDGGHLLYYVAELLKGSPVSERVMELGQRVGLTVLLFLMAFAFYNDINRLLAG
jgi:regulator of sigma E protease